MGKSIWTKEAEEFIVESWDSCSYEEIVSKLNKHFIEERRITLDSLKKKAVRLGLKLKGRKDKWSSKEKDFLVKNYADKTARELSEGIKRLFGTSRSEFTIKNKAVELGLSDTKIKWTYDNEMVLMKHWGGLPFTAISALLNRMNNTNIYTPSRVRTRGISLGLSTPHSGDGIYLTSADVGYLLNKSRQVVYYLEKRGCFGEVKVYKSNVKKLNKGIKQFTGDNLVYFLRNNFDKYYLADLNMGELKNFLGSHSKLNWIADKREYDSKIKRSNYQAREWTTMELNVLMYGKMMGKSFRVLSQELRRSESSVRSKWYQYNKEIEKRRTSHG